MPHDIRSFKRARAASRDEQAVWIRFIRMCKRNKTLRYIFIVILFLFIVFFAGAIFHADQLSKVGDAFNILNTFFTALAFIGLIVTILLQRKDLALQREELKLQREEMQRQCAEQKRQADEFEAQNRLMKIQQFESFFFKQLEYLNYLSKNIHFGEYNGDRAISKISIIVKESLEYIKGSFESSMAWAVLDRENEYNMNWDKFDNSYEYMIPWCNKFYSLNYYIMNLTILDEKEKWFYIKLLFEILSGHQQMMLQIMGCISSNDIYRELEKNLEKKEFFPPSESVLGKDKELQIFKSSLGYGKMWCNFIKSNL